MHIVEIRTVPQPNHTGYHWVYGLADDNKIYVWHEKKGEWVLLKKSYG